ncbi:cytochrome P450 [Actinoplanes sp. L3-i22]|nr:cytochrome P450 [Actinoplanes sp. L3-i22]
MDSIYDSDTEGMLRYPPRRKCPFDVPEAYAGRRRDEPASKVVMSDGRPVWLLTRYDDVRAVLADPRFGADRLADGFPVLAPGQTEGLRQQPKFMISMDGAEHSTAKRPLIPEFSARRVAEMAPQIQQIVDNSLDAVLAKPQPADLVEEFALQVPTILLAQLIGADHGDHEFFKDLVFRMIWRKTDGPERVEISKRLKTYFEKLIADKVAATGDDVLSRLIARQLDETGEVNVDVLNSTAQLLLIAGYESSASMISLGIYTLLTNPGLRAEIAADPEKTPFFVDEMLRFYSILDVAAGRVALEDVEIAGVTIRAGEGVMASTFAANRDPKVFPDPDLIDIHRASRQHVAFGYGPHQCIGANLARLELRIVFDTVLRRVPQLRLAVDENDLPFKYDALAFGLHELPVAW